VRRCDPTAKQRRQSGRAPGIVSDAKALASVMRGSARLGLSAERVRNSPSSVASGVCSTSFSALLTSSSSWLLNAN
jgi:hypothetical protein